MIEIKELSVSYKEEKERTALENINLSVAKGGIYTIIGPSGCGKSTLLNVLAGIHRNYQGSVLIDGKGINPKTHNIGMVFQNYGLLPWKNVYENSIMGLRIKGDKTSGTPKYAEHILEELGLTNLLNRYPGELSGGQQQRVAIARAFIIKPELLLMDEPFSALDAINREEIQELFLRIWKEHRVTTIFITHSVDEALYLGQKIIVLSQCPGKILKCIDNEMFGVNDIRLREEFYKKSMEIRKIIETSWLK